jgi:hypothetical protein
MGIPETAVVTVLATHWHDDHISGLSEVVENCKNATFACSVAQRDQEFFAFIYTYDQAKMMRKTGVREIRRILDLLEEKPQSVVWVNEMRRIFHRSGDSPASLWSLSPSDEAITLAKQSVAKWLPKEDSAQKAAVSMGANHFAVALLVEVDELRILLGADLLEFGNERMGWSRILELQKEQNIKKASSFKIPHHGSENADCAGIWINLLQSDPVAVVTPFFLAGTALPKQSDIKRISNYTCNAFITAPSRAPRPKRRNNAVERSIREHNIRLRLANGPTGQVRIRWPRWKRVPMYRVELFGPALSLADLE